MTVPLRREGNIFLGSPFMMLYVYVTTCDFLRSIDADRNSDFFLLTPLELNLKMYYRLDEFYSFLFHLRHSVHGSRLIFVTCKVSRG